MKRVALITGAAGGIGSVTVDVFRDAGWSVVGVDRRGTPSDSDGVRGVHADVAVESEVEAIFEEIEAIEGRLDAVVNNAAIQVCKPLLETSLEEWNTLLQNNLTAAFLVSRRAVPLLAQSAGAVINVSSVHALATSKNKAAYAATKGALLALTRAMALELGESGIRVNAVLPGATDTPMLRAGLLGDRAATEVQTGEEERLLDELSAKHVLGRVAQPEEAAEAMLFLADSRRSSFVTGQALVVDGGATARLSTE
ncbi:MAG: SDR family oxidoreductase [Thermoanaerobaculia bacterium]|nr:SDR family oxidoreductase [Thermoanaerobaculia bacterium]